MHNENFVNHTDVVGAFSHDPDRQFKEGITNVYESMNSALALDVYQDVYHVLRESTASEQYKEQLFSDVLESSLLHQDKTLEVLPQKLEQLFENTREEILLESYDGNLQPIVGYSLPILKKSFLKSVGKDILQTEVPQQPVIKVAFERQFIKNREGEKFYIPEIFYDDSYKEVMEEAHGNKIPTDWYPKEGSGPVRINELDLLAEAGGSMRRRDTISPNFHIDAVKMDVEGKEIIVDNIQIRPERSMKGGFSAEVVGLTEEGEQVSDTLSGRLDLYSGLLSVSCSAGLITHVRFNGRLSNQNNTNTVEIDMERESFTWEIPHGAHVNTGLTVENLKDQKALNNIDVAARAMSDMATVFNQYEDSEQIDYIIKGFDRWHGRSNLPLGFKNGFTELYTFDAIAPATTMLPDSEWVHDIKFRLNRQMDALKEKLKTEELTFVITANPAHIALFTDTINWVFNKSNDIGGVGMEYSYGIMNNSQSSARVVSTMKIPREAGIHILAYPTSGDNITRKHYKYSQAIRNDYRNPFADNTPNIMAESRFLTTEVTPIHGRMDIQNDEFGRRTLVR